MNRREALRLISTAGAAMFLPSLGTASIAPACIWRRWESSDIWQTEIDEFDMSIILSRSYSLRYGRYQVVDNGWFLARTRPAERWPRPGEFRKHRLYSGLLFEASSLEEAQTVGDEFVRTLRENGGYLPSDAEDPPWRSVPHGMFPMKEVDRGKGSHQR